MSTVSTIASQYARQRRTAWIGAAVLLVVLLVALHGPLDTTLGQIDIRILSFRVYGPILALGAIKGMTYGVLAVGLVMVYRASGIINFAHGQIGAFGAVIFGLLVSSWGLPYWVALPLAVVVGALVGAGSEVTVIRRLRTAPRVMSVVATLGLGQVLLLIAAVMFAQSSSINLVPEPPGVPSFHIGLLFVQPSYTAMLFLTPAVVAVLALFLQRSRTGLAIRGAAVNPETARMVGVPVERMATIAWALAGAVATYTAVLILPSEPGGVVATFGPALVLRALLPAVIARMQSLPIALIGGLAVGEVEQEVLLNYHQQGGQLVQAVLFVIILGVLLVQPAISGRGEPKGAWAAIEAWPPLSDALRRVWAVRNLGRILFGATLVIAAAAPLWMSNASAVTLTGMVAFIIVGLSLGIITGLGGQVSLGHFGLAGLGALAAVVVVAHSGSFLFGFLAAAALAGVASLLIGVPALRIRGLFLAVTTLGFALSTPWILQQEWAFSSGVEPGRPQLGSVLIDTGRPYYYFALAVMLIATLIAYRVWTGGFGRLLRAVRDNEDAARAFTVRTTIVKVQAFVLSGVLAGLGGAVFAYSLSAVAAGSFPVDSSVSSLAMTVLGGAGVFAGPVIGAFYIIGIPAFVPIGGNSTALLATAAGWLIIVVQFPGGLAQAARPLRDWLVRKLASEGEAAPEAANAAVATRPRWQPARVERPATNDSAAGPILEVRGLSRSFGGISAVRGVDLTVQRGETVGLIGPNGAGKTTLFELISGFTKPDAGRVLFEGHDVTGASPDRRGRLGLIRSFQDVALFPTLTVLDTVMVSLERRHRTSLAATLLGSVVAEQARRAEALEVVAGMGLERYRDVPVRALSTGTRRIAEMACLVALQPALLLLDEPSSGIAQRETEALADLIGTVKSQLDATVVIIEHDMPLVTGLSNRLVAMEAGAMIAEGPPAHVLADPRVVESYLGTETAAIERSDVRAPLSLAGGAA